jgi:pimeloyl-ACP methyl ester carboxylesterase
MLPAPPSAPPPSALRPSPSPPIRRGYLDGRFGQLHYRRCQPPDGAGRPLLLLHQSPVSSLQFVAAMPALAAAGHDVVALDLPGFGMSDPTGPEPSLADFTSCLDDAFAGLAWPRGAVLGHHTGAALAASWAVGHPERIERLVLNGMPILSAAEREHFRGFKFGPVLPDADGSHLTRGWANRIRATPGWTDLASMHRLYVEGLVSGATSWRAFPVVVGADLRATLQAIRVPTLLLTNTGEDLYAATQRARELRPDFAYVELEGGTHDIVDEQPAAWAAAVSAFLR